MPVRRPILPKGCAGAFVVCDKPPFEDGNGRIARAIAEMQLAQADDSPQRFYSMSSQIRKERNDYYDILEKHKRAAWTLRLGWNGFSTASTGHCRQLVTSSRM